MANDCNKNGIPDACKPDCNQNGIADACELVAGLLSDVNDNNVPDACEAVFVDQTASCPGDGSSQAPFCTISHAVAASLDSEVIIIRPGHYVENIDLESKSLTLRSMDPENPEIVESTIIDGGGKGTVIAATGAIFDCHISQVISGLTITGGGIDEVGGIDLFYSALKLTYCRIINNQGSKVGGLRVRAVGSLLREINVLVDHCTITGNVAGSDDEDSLGFAGGAYLSGTFEDGGDWTIQNGYVAENVHQGPLFFSSGGMYIERRNTMVRNTTFESNRVTMFDLESTQIQGGGMTTRLSIGTVVEDCMFIGNVPDGLEAWHTIAVRDSAFLRNGPIGGCFNSGGGSPDGNIADCFFCGNSGNAYWSLSPIDDIDNFVSLICDCNNNGTDDDRVDVISGFESDCNGNEYPDSCDVLQIGDCNANGLPDMCDIDEGTSLDENPADGIPDDCQWVGACCVFGGCLTMRLDECVALGGRGHGPDVNCEDDPYCGPPIRADFDDDGDVDLLDFGTFQLEFTGQQKLISGADDA
jgi:hypothetical protein